MLGANQTSMDGTIKTGKLLMDKSSDDDAITIEGKIADLKTRWDAICALSVERQQKLEEALLFTGMFQDALQSLLDWLNAVEPSLSTETAVMGDPETVQILIDNHKTFQRELGRRQANYDSVMNAGRGMVKENRVEDPHKLEEKLEDLRVRWEAITSLAATKQDRLDNSLVLANEFDSAVKTELRILKDFEDTLRGLGPISDDLEIIAEQLNEHKVSHEELMAEEVNVQSAIKKGQVIARFCHPSALPIIQQWIARLKKRWEEVRKWSVQRLTRLEEEQAKLYEEQNMMEELLQWIDTKEGILIEKENEHIPDDDYEQVVRLLEDHKGFQEEMATKQPTYDRLTKSVKRRGSVAPVVASAPVTSQSTPEHKQGRRGSKIPKLASPGTSFTRERSREKLISPGSSFTRSGSTTLDKNHPALLHLSKRWQHLWLLSMERLKRLQELLDRIAIRRASAKFDFIEWKNRFNKWLRDSKSRVLDIFRRMDHDLDGKLTRDEFITGILNTSFPTERWEMEIVASKFERDGLIDYREFVNMLKDKKPASKKPEKPKSEEQQIQSEVERQCRKYFIQYIKVAENKYRFGDSQKLRLVRILRSTVMVRVGGGWETLEEFLQKNEFSKAVGRTNVELRENVTRPEGVAQAMGSFTSKPLMTREHSGTQLKGAAAERPPAGPGRKPRLDVQSSGYGIRREKSGDLRPRREKSGELRSPSGPSRQGSGTKLRATVTTEKTSTTKKVLSPRVKKSDSQSSLGSTGSLEDSSESPRVSSGTSASSSRGSPSPRAAPVRTGSRESLRGSRENVRGSRESLKAKDGKETTQSTSKRATSGVSSKSPPKAKKNGQEKSGTK